MLAGSSFVEPIGYRAIVDAAAGATTVAANPYAPQSVLLGSDSVTYFAAGGSGTVLAATSASVIYFQQSQDSVFVAGGADTIVLQGW